MYDNEKNIIEFRREISSSSERNLWAEVQLYSNRDFNWIHSLVLDVFFSLLEIEIKSKTQFLCEKQSSCVSTLWKWYSLKWNAESFLFEVFFPYERNDVVRIFL